MFSPSEILPLVVGLYMMGLGVLTLIVARMTTSKLDALRKALGENADPEHLRNVFKAYDKDSSGAIERAEFAHVRHTHLGTHERLYANVCGLIRW